MTVKRMIHIIRMALMNNGYKRAEYMKKNHIFKEQGENCFYQPRNIPPEAELIKLHNNVVIASEVLFVNHDVIHYMARKATNANYDLNLGAIEIGNNVFIGSRCTILPDTKIEDNVIIGAGSLVRGHLESGGVYAGVPVKRIGDFDAVLSKRAVEKADPRRKTERFDDTWAAFNKKYGIE